MSASTIIDCFWQLFALFGMPRHVHTDRASSFMYDWLKQFLQVHWEAEKTGELLTDLGLEVEGIETKESIKGSLAGVIVGEV